MMIEVFKNYVKEYDLEDEDIRVKYEHSLRVMNLMVKYAEDLGYSEEEIELAKIIGLLHDIGRFEQLKVYHTYNDHKSVDHADYSVVQLFDKKQIRLFTDREEWYSIIKFAIKNHNKLEIPECMDERVLKLTKLIRDVDKLDIIYLLGVLGNLNNKIDYSLDITPDVERCVFKNICVDSKIAKNYNDRLVVQLAFVFDINNSILLKEYKEYLEAYYRQLEDDGRFRRIYDEIIRYIDERILEDERNRN